MWCTSAQPASARRPETRWRFHLSCCPDFGVHFSPVSLFAYPFGALDSSTVSAVRAGGFQAAVTCDESTISAGHDLLRLPRLEIAAHREVPFDLWLERHLAH